MVSKLSCNPFTGINGIKVKKKSIVGKMANAKLKAIADALVARYPFFNPEKKNLIT